MQPPKKKFIKKKKMLKKVIFQAEIKIRTLRKILALCQTQLTINFRISAFKSRNDPQQNNKS